MLHIIEFESMKDIMGNSRGLLKAVIDGKYCYYMDNVDKGMVSIQVVISDIDYINKVAIDSATGAVINNAKHGGISINRIKLDNVVFPILSEYIKHKEKIIDANKEKSK